MHLKHLVAICIYLALLPSGCFLDEEPDVPSGKVFNQPEWRSISSFPFPAMWGQSFGIEVNGKAYVGMYYSVADYIDSTNTTIHKVDNSFWEYDPKKDLWTKKSDFPGKSIYYAVSFSIGNKGYMGLGTSGGGDFWEYDPQLDAFTRKTDFPGGDRLAPSGFSIGDKGYVGFGISNTNERKADFYEFDPQGNNGKGKWQQIESLDSIDSNGYPRAGAIGFSIAGKGYITCGHTYSKKNMQGVYTLLNDLWEFNPANPLGKKWTKLEDIPQGRDGGAAFSINGKGYVGCGVGGSKATLNDFYEYDPLQPKWTKQPDVPGLGRLFPSAFSLRGKGYLGLGSLSTNFQHGRFMSDFWVYTPYTTK